MVVLQCLACFKTSTSKEKRTSTQSTIMYLKTSISKESDVNPIYLSQHMFKNIQVIKESDVNTIYHNIFKNVHLKRK
jgi:hypothetical protein